MAITITAKLDTKDVTDKAKGVVDSVKEMGDAADSSSESMRESLESVKRESDALKQKYKELGKELDRVGRDGSEAAQEITRQMSETDGAINKCYLEAKLLEAELSSLPDDSMQRLDEVAGELKGQLSDLKGRTEALKDALASMEVSGTGSLGRVESAAGDAGLAMEDVAGVDYKVVIESITAISTGYLALVDIAGRFVGAGKKCVEVVELLAADGNPAAMELSESFGGVREQLLQLAESPIFQNVFQDFAELVNTQVIPAIEAIPGAMFDSVSAVQLQLMGVKEFMGQVPEGTTEMMRQMHDMARVAYKTADELSAKSREERKAKAEVAKVDAELAKIQAEKDADATQAALDNIKTEEELRDVIESLTESIREQAKEGKLSDEQKEKSLRTIAQAEERIKRLKSESAETEKKSAEESVKIAGDASSERVRVLQEEAENRGKLAREALDQERRNIEERKRLIAGTKGVESLMNSISPDAVKEEYARRAGESAENAERLAGFSRRGNRDALERRADSAKQEMERAKQALDSANRVDDSIPESSSEYRGYIQSRNKERERARKEFVAAREAYKSADSERDAANEDVDTRELAKIRRAAVERARRNVQSGNVDQNELRSVQADMASKTIDMAHKQGKLSGDTAQALRETTAELAKGNGETERLNAEVENLRKMIGAIAAAGNRRRAQVAGSRQ